MSKWLERLREHEKSRQMGQSETFKTIETPETEVLRVLKGCPRQESENFSDTASLAGDEAASHYEERAAILEYDCGLSRAEAERLARMQISATRH